MSEPEAADALDLDACAAEPIRIPGGIQPHGALIVVDPQNGTVLHVSANLADITGLDLSPGEALAGELAALVAELAALEPKEGQALRTVALSDRALQLAAHRTPQGLILEFEAPPRSPAQTLEALYPRITRFLAQMAGASAVAELAYLAVSEIRALTGFNRILLYCFDAEGVGTVLAEDNDGVLPSYLNLRFPAADIPAQARELYKLSRTRLIPTADYTPAPVIPPISPVDGQPLDLGRAALRSVSPVHLEYMRNMGTQSSMSISIVVEGELWGLISGHSAEPFQVNAQVRSVCDHLGQVLSLQIEAREQALRTARSLALRQVQADLLTRVAAAPDYAAGLARHPEFWEDVGGGDGAALVSGGDVISVGMAPEADDIRLIAERLFEANRTEAAIESLAQEWPDLERVAGTASGVLAVSVSQLHPNYLMWFRPEAVRTVEWAGEPQKARELGERLHPRKSFALWKEQVRLRAMPWRAEEVESARVFRGAIQDFVLRRAEERAELTNKLAEINRELESFSYSISHDLRAPFRHVVGFAELLADRAKDSLDPTAAHYLESIKGAALSAGRLVDDLLSFSQLGRHSLKPSRVEMKRLVAEIRRSMEPSLLGRKISWIVGDMPPAWGDAAMLRQVLQNLMENAVKYTGPRNPATIEISGEDLPAATSYTITDNGVGFDMAYAHKLFAVFERLHRAEEFEGTGIGLALVRRIVDRHGGTVSAHGALNAGASFTVTLPKRATAPVTGETTLG